MPIMAYKSLHLALAAFASVAAALPAASSATTRQATSEVIPGKFIVALRPEVELDLHTRWVSDVHGEALRRRGDSDSVGVEKTFDAPGFHGYAGSFDDETVATIKANSSVSLFSPHISHLSFFVSFARSCGPVGLSLSV